MIAATMIDPPNERRESACNEAQWCSRMIPIVRVALLAFVVACSNGDGNTSKSVGKSGSATSSVANVSPPKEDMVLVEAGRYLLSESAFEPDSAGNCSTAIFEKVEALMSSAPWPDASQQIETFTLDRHTVSCDDYARCVRANKCSKLEREGMSCVHGFARATLEQAVAFCRWRDAKLPTLMQWQAAFRGPDGKQFGECDPSLDAEVYSYTAASGAAVEIEAIDNEFTSTIGCWPLPLTRPRKPGRYPVLAFLLARQLSVFTPYDPSKTDPIPRARFRCVRDQSLVVPDRNR